MDNSVNTSTEDAEQLASTLQRTIGLLEKFESATDANQASVLREIKSEINEQVFERFFQENQEWNEHRLQALLYLQEVRRKLRQIENETYFETMSRVLVDCVTDYHNYFEETSDDYQLWRILVLGEIEPFTRISKHTKTEHHYVSNLKKHMSLVQSQQRMNLEIEYLESLESQLLFVDCAGVPARTSKLFTNQTFSPRYYIDEWKAFIDVCQNCDSINQELVSKLSHKIISEAFVSDKHQFKHIDFDSKALERIFPNLEDKLFEIWEEFTEDEKTLLEEKFWERHGRRLEVKRLSRKSHDMFQRYITVKEPGKSHDPGVCILSGEPGFGKSIAMKQACLRHVQQEVVKLERAIRVSDTHSTKLPVYYEAKKLAKHLLELFKSEWSEGPAEVFDGFFSSDEGLIIDDLKTSYPELNTSCFGRFEHIENFNLIYFVDAYDECSEDEKNILSLFIRFSLDSGHQVVVSTRTNDVQNLYSNIRDIDFIPSHDEVEINELPDIVLNLLYDKQDLQESMPRQLAMAWGIDEISYKDKVAKTVDSYQKVLTHPVFVGLFCRLLQENDLPDMKEVHLIDEAFAGYTVRHVKFYEIVIEKAIEHAVKKRHKNRKKRDLERYTEAFYRIAWHNEFSDMTEIGELVDYVSTLYQYHFDEQEKKILRDDMGLVYARGMEVSWVHRTLKEVAIGTLLASEEVFSDRLKRTRYSGRRRMKNLHSFAVLTYCVQRITPEDDTLARPLVTALRELGNSASKAIFNEIGPTQAVFRTLKKNHEYSLVNGINPIWEEIAELYIQQGVHQSVGEKFTLPNIAFQKLSPSGIAVVLNDFQRIDLRSTRTNELPAFPDISLQDLYWIYRNDVLYGESEVYQLFMAWFLIAEAKGKISRKAGFSTTWKAQLRNLAIEMINHISVQYRLRDSTIQLLDIFATDLTMDEINYDRELVELTLDMFSREHIHELNTILLRKSLDINIKNPLILDVLAAGRVTDFSNRLIRFMSTSEIRNASRMTLIMQQIPPENKPIFVRFVMMLAEFTTHRHGRFNLLIKSETTIQDAASQFFDLFSQRQCAHCDEKDNLRLVGKLFFDPSLGPKPNWYCHEHDPRESRPVSD